VSLLLQALKSGDIPTWTLNFQQKRRLQMHRDAQIRESARAIFEQSGKEREAVQRRYETALEQKADAARGREVFEQVCSKCHLFQGKGAEVGPDLATVRNQPKQVLLTDILSPSRSIAQGYEAYVVELASGGSLDGVIGPQTPTTITLRHEDGKEDVIPRQAIKQMYATTLSAMPADLDKQVDPQQMADLLEFLKTGR
jgi:putative heme-binding domain-containing protein